MITILEMTTLPGIRAIMPNTLSLVPRCILQPLHSGHVLDEWKEIGANDYILSIISVGVKPEFLTEPSSIKLNNHKLTPIQEHFIESEIKELLRSGAIRAVSDTPKCVSPLGCVNKKGNKLRLITDFR